MNITKSWINICEERIEIISKLLLTGEQFNEELCNLCLLDDSPFSAIHFSIEDRDNTGQTTEYGILGEGEPTSKTTYNLKQGTKYQLKFWRKPSATEQNIGSDDIRKLFETFWKDEYRNATSKIISPLMPEAKAICNDSLNNFSQFRYSLFVFGDLDRFKLANDFCNMKTGDRVIFEFGSLLSIYLDKNAIVIHKSGDEFVVVMHCNKIEDAILDLYQAYKNIKKHNFNLIAQNDGKDDRTGDLIKKGEKITLDVSFGVSYIDRSEGQLVPSWDEWFTNAEKIMAKKQGGPRGTLRINPYYSDNGPDNIAIDECDYFKLIYSFAKSNIDDQYPFANIWLNMFSKLISEAGNIDEIKSSIEAYIAWIQPSDTENRNYLSIYGENIIFCPEFSCLDKLIAATHGLSRNKLESRIHFKIIKNEIILFQDEYEILKSPIDYATDMEKIDFIITKKNQKPEMEKSIDWAKKVIMVKIGHAPLTLPKKLFFIILVLDDRPAKGGALPDFWEPIVSQIINIISKNKNITHIFVNGEQNYGKEFINVISGMEKWDDDYIQWLSEKTKCQTKDIQEAKKRLVNNVILENNNEKIINSLFEIYSKENEVYSVENINIDHTNRILLRKNNLEEKHYLKPYDGIRISTISEAYPIMLDIVRSMISEKETVTLIDQAGRGFIELIDFKVHLERPFEKMIPHFFMGRDNDTMESYYQSAFGNNGLFVKEFNENEQYNRVISHIIETCASTKERFATRRAILVVPNKDPSLPLGLVSVRIIPRFEGKNIKLNFSFTWRTVEAVKGFPYSLYGSVKFSEHIKEDIKKRFENKNQSIIVGNDTVSYMAHSLHMFTDEDSQEIIRGIINDASK
jgi:diguanylate cyclase (GGDEF)-like protein